MADIHSPRVIGDMDLSNDSSLPTHPVTRRELERVLGYSPIHITDVTPVSGGIVANKGYFADTVPANSLLSSAISNTNDVRVSVVARGLPFTPPDVEVDGVEVANWSPMSETLFEGTVDLNVTESKTVTATNITTGVEGTVDLTLLIGGPEVTLLTIGTLPGSQTEVKAGDVLSFTGTVDNSAESVELVIGGAAGSGNISTLNEEDSAGVGYRSFAGTFTVGTNSGDLGIAVRGQNFLGTYGDNGSSANTITLNQTKPSIGTISANYPDGNNALKDGESATVAATVSNFDSINYSYVGSDDVTITDPEVYAVSKTVTLNTGDYEVSANYQITATKASNGAVTTKTGTVRIATTAATAAFSIVGSPSRLRTSSAGETYTLVVSPNQDVSNEPTITVPTGATWQTGWSKSGSTYRRDFVIDDTTARGDLDFVGTLINDANVSNAISGTFEVGGITERVITFNAFARKMAIGTTVVDFTKTRARYDGTGSDLTRRTDTVDVQGAFTIVNAADEYDPNGGYLFLNDAAFAGANTSGTLGVIFEETV